MVKKSQFLSLTTNATTALCQEELLTSPYEKVKAVVDCLIIVNDGSPVFE